VTQKPHTVRLYGTADDSIVDGPGIRFTLFVQGCTHRCPGCHNPKAQPAQGGVDTSLETLQAHIENNPLISGVTFSGGEPFEQAEPLLELAQWIRQLERLGKDGTPKAPLSIWIYSGYTYEQLLEGIPNAQALELLKLCDVLVDGLFLQDQQNYELKWRGSANQRIIDIPSSLASGRIVPWNF